MGSNWIGEDGWKMGNDNLTIDWSAACMLKNNHGRAHVITLV